MTVVQLSAWEVKPGMPIGYENGWYRVHRVDVFSREPRHSIFFGTVGVETTTGW